MRLRTLEQRFWSAHSRNWDDALADPDVAGHVVDLVDWFVRTLPSGAVAVDLGCGTGNHVLALRGRGVRAVGLELAPGMLQAARSKAVGGLVRADLARSLPLADRALDGAISIYVAQFLDLPRFLAEVRRVLRPGGALLLEVPQPRPGQRRDVSDLSRRYRSFQRFKQVAAAAGHRLGLVRWHSLDDLRQALDANGFDRVEHRTSGPGLAVLAHTRR